jgi:hypothetical protein
MTEQKGHPADAGARKPFVFEEDQIVEFVDIVHAAIHDSAVIYWTMDLLDGGVNAANLREMARRWREWEFDPQDFAARLELLADDMEAE